MIIKDKYIYLEHDKEWGDQMFKGITITKNYFVLENTSCWRVVVCFQKPNSLDWWEVESDSVWVPDWIRNKITNPILRKTPSALSAIEI